MGFKIEDDRICSATTECKMHLRVPLNGNINLEGKALACVRLAPDNDDQLFSASVVQAEVDIQDNMHVTCEISRLGRYMVSAGVLRCRAGAQASEPLNRRLCLCV